MRAAVIGCGAIASQHLPFLKDSNLAELVAVCDTSPATAKFAQERFGADAAFTDAAKMLEAANPAIVHVLTPPHTHESLVRACLDAGAHVICEKPMAPSAAETIALLDYAAQKGRMLFESRNYLFNDPVLHIAKLIATGRLGAILDIDLLLSVDFLSGPFGDENLLGPGVALPGGAVHDFLPHLAYLFLHFADQTGEVVEVHGRLENLSGNRRATYDFLDALVVAGGVRGRLRVAADVRPQSFRVHVRGDQASIETDLFNPFWLFEGPPNLGKRTSLGQIRNGLKLIGAGVANFRNKVMQHGTYHGMPRMLDAIYRAVSGDGSAPFDRSDMVDAARLVDRLVALRTDDS